jgi:hypothetical protein
MLVNKIKELATDLGRVYQDLRSLQLDMRLSPMDEREVDVDQIIEDLNILKLNVTYLRLKASELTDTKREELTEIKKDIHYFVTYMKHSFDTFNEICNSLQYGGRSGDEVAYQKSVEEIVILQRHLHDMNDHLDQINAKLGKK